MPEPLDSGAEPASPQPADDINIADGDGDITEPAPIEPEEPAEGTEEFTDLKQVPKELQSIAKKMQADYTRKMQKLSETEKPSYTPPETDFIDEEPEVTEVKNYLQTPQGQTLVKAIGETYGLDQLTNEVKTQRANAEIDDVIKVYGEEVLKENYDQIQQMADDNPDVPLDLICAKVLYGKAKAIGEKEFRAKLQKKGDNSFGVTSASPNVTTEKPASSFEDAFQQALRTHRAG